MSEKEKPKRGSRYGILRSCLMFSLYPLLILAVFSIGLAYWAIGGYVKPSLDAQYIPTAEYLLDNPIIQGDSDKRIIFEANIAPYCPLSFNFATFLDATFNPNWAELYINEQLVSRVHLGTIVVAGDFEAYCYEGHLNSGLHIIEFRVKEHPFAEPYYIQRWAIEIE